MSRKVVAVLLTAFLWVSVGSVPVYAWCFGEDGHLAVGQTAVTGCVDDQDKPKVAVKHDTPSLYSPDAECCGPCLDFSTQQNDSVFFKKLKKITSAPNDAIALNIFQEASIQNVKLVVGNLAPQPPPRISQSILAHRTIVLLV